MLARVEQSVILAEPETKENECDYCWKEKVVMWCQIYTVSNALTEEVVNQMKKDFPTSESWDSNLDNIENVMRNALTQEELNILNQSDAL